VAQGVVLGAAADLIERGVGEADHMEVVDHEPGVGQALGDGSGIGLVGVDDHMADPGQPPCRLGCQPLGHRDRAASRQNIDEAAGVEIDDPGHQHGGVLGGGGQERGLIEAHRAGGAEAGEVIDARSAVIAHRRHRRVPRHPEVPSCLSDGVLVGTDPAGDLGPGPFGQHGPRRDVVRLLGPCARRTHRLGTAPQPLGPHQHDRPIGERQVPNGHPTPSMARRVHTARLAPGPILGGLHRQPPLTGRFLEQLGTHDEPVEPEQR
jgi:hypothetical protein